MTCHIWENWLRYVGTSCGVYAGRIKALRLAIPSLFSPYLEGIAVNSSYVQRGPLSISERRLCFSEYFSLSLLPMMAVCVMTEIMI
jgi:hypothetical protein